MDDTLSATDAAPAVEPVDAPPFPEVLKALGSLIALGAVAGLGTGDAGMAARTIPSGLVVGAGAMLLSGPALLVSHQFLGLKGRPEALAASLVRSVVRLGTVSLGVVPLVAFFSITSRLGPAVFATTVAAGSVFALSRLVSDLMRVESDTPEGGRLAREGTMAFLVLGWVSLVCLVALRLAWDVLFFVIA